MKSGITFKGTLDTSRPMPAGKTAIIMTGHTRTLAKCLPTLQWHVFRLFPDARIFFSTIDDEDFQECEQPVGDWTIDAVKDQPKWEFDHPWVPGTMFTHEPYSISVSPQAVVAQLWQLNEGWRLYLKNTAEQDFANLFIRCRPDLWFHSFEVPKFPLTSSGHGREVAPWACFTPWWGQFGGSNDRFAIMGREAAEHYFTTFTKLDRLRQEGCPLHPESLVKASLLDGKVDHRPILKAEFSTLRNNGEMRPPEISGIDIAHACLRPARTV